MPLTVPEFREAVRVADTFEGRAALINREVLDRIPHAFEGNEALYTGVRTHLAQALGAEVESVCLVGSGAVGFSLAPRNFTRAFHDESDLDFAVVSEQLFDEVWDKLLLWGHPVRHTVPADAQRWFRRRQDEVFWGWLDPEKLRFGGVTRPSLLNGLVELRLRWFDTFRGLGQAFPETDVATRQVSARLYRSRMHLVHYQANGLLQVRNQLTEDQSHAVS